jgi:prevent-host-death family protein
MKRASISEAKNALSALLDRVRQGATIVIEDRGVPVARLEPVAAGTDPEGRLARLARQGLIRPPARALSAAWLKTPPPRLIEGRSASDIILAERREGR